MLSTNDYCMFVLHHHHHHGNPNTTKAICPCFKEEASNSCAVYDCNLYFVWTEFLADKKVESLAASNGLD